MKNIYIELPEDVRSSVNTEAMDSATKMMEEGKVKYTRFEDKIGFIIESYVDMYRSFKAQEWFTEQRTRTDVYPLENEIKELKIQVQQLKKQIR